MSIPASGPAPDRAGESRPASPNGRHTAHVVVIGGGITGLSTAWHLKEGAHAAGLHLRITLLEAADRWGGKVRTERIEGFGAEPFIIEAGPDSFITQKPWALELAGKLGLDERIIDTNDDRRKTFVLSGGKPRALPDGVLMIVPTKIMPFALSPLFSPLAKLRMGFDLVIPAKRDGEDETVAEFITRRLGAEALDKLAEPLMSGIYNADAEHQSVLATFPRFRRIEEQHGSLIRGMLASRRSRPAPSAEAAPKHGMFASFCTGNQELIDALAADLQGVDARLNTPVAGIERLPDGRYAVQASDETLEVDSVIVTAPTYVAAELLAEVAPAAVDALAGIRYVSTGTISLGYRADEVDHPLAGFGIVIPRSERRPINAITWSSTKFDHRAPAGHVLLRVFFGGSRSPQTMDKTDEEVLTIARHELADIMGIRAEPVLHRINRWHDSNPQYDVGHLDRVDAIEAALPPGVYVTGSGYRGIGLPDCVHQGQMTAAKVLEALGVPARG